jgi:hypothetical protein
MQAPAALFLVRRSSVPNGLDFLKPGAGLDALENTQILLPVAKEDPGSSVFTTPTELLWLVTR